MFSKFFSRVQLVSLAAVGGVVTAVLAGVAGPPVRAGLIAYEPFNYPSLANGSNFCPPTAQGGSTTTGTTSNALGFNGAYTFSVPVLFAPTAASVTYDTAGPSFAGLQAGGGAAAISSPGNAQGTATLSVEFGGTMAGSNTLYGGYLVQTAAVQPSYSAGIVIGGQNAQASSSTSQIDMAVMDANASPTSGGNNMGGLDVAHVSGTSPTITSNTGTAVGIGTYLALFKVTGVNATSGPVSMQDWVLTDAQYQHFLANGGITSANLDAAATGTGSSNVVQVGSFSDNNPTAWPQFNSGSYISYWTYLGFTTPFDELRLSDGRLADVAPVVPEPATLGLLAIGGLGLMLQRRRAA